MEKLTDIYPKTEQPTPLAMGDYLRFEDGEVYHIVKADHDAVLVVSLLTGIRWDSPVKVRSLDRLSGDEAKELAVELSRWHRLTRAEAAKWLADHA